MASLPTTAPPITSPPGKPTRRLATVLVADAVGFSRRMGENEQAAVSSLLDSRDLLIRSVGAHGGNTIGTPGDFLLAIMPSGREAIDCAIDIQDRLAERNLRVEPELRTEFRIGIGVGDIFESGGDVLGDAVNIASRLQAITAPGGIIVSGAVRDIVGHGDGFEFEYLGDQNLKNLVMPVRCFQVVLTDASAKPGAARRLHERPPVKPVVEIEPFRVRSTNEEEQLFGEAFTEEVITILASLTASLVVRAASDRDNGIAGHRDAARLYRLKGSIRRAGERAQIVAQLLVRGSGDTIWAERYDYAPGEFFDAQERIAREVVTAIQVTLTEGDQAAFWSKGTSNVKAWELFQKGHDLERRFTREAHRQAHAAYEAALAQDPRYVSAIVALAFCHLDEIRLGWTADIEASFRVAEALYRRACGIESEDPQCFALLAYLELRRRNDSAAVAAMERAIQLAPRSGELTAYLAYIYDTVGRYDDAIEAYSRAMQLSVHYPAWIATNLGFALCAVGRVVEAQRVLLGVVQNQPDYVRAYLGLAIAYCRQGLIADAQQAALEISRRDSLFSIEAWAQDRPYADPAITAGIILDLRAAGLK